MYGPALLHSLPSLEYIDTRTKVIIWNPVAAVERVACGTAGASEMAHPEVNRSQVRVSVHTRPSKV